MRRPGAYSTGRHHAQIEFTSGKKIVELRRGGRDDPVRCRDDAAIHRRVDGCGVDPGNPAKPHAA